MADKKRLTLDFDPKAYEILTSLSTETGKTMAGVIRSAVALYAITHAEEKGQRRLAIVDSQGKTLKEIIVT
jgi:predicted DNA-binding protein